MAKKKKPNKAERRKIRLQKALQWVLRYEGTHMVQDYGKRFKVDPVCALNDMRAIGALQPEKLAEMKRNEVIRLENKRKEREARQARETQDLYPDSSDNFFYVAGYTPGGAPYGVTWDEMGMEPYEPIMEPAVGNPQKKQPKQQKPHGHNCKICGQHKANEKFSGKGHAAHICKQCASLPVKERNDEVTLRKIEGMAFRYLSETEINWLRKKMKDADPEISEAARMAHSIKFPHYERNKIKKGLTAYSLEFFLHGTVWDEYGDEVLVNMRFFADNSGAMRRVDYDAPEGEREETITIERREAAKFLKAVVQQLNTPFWSEDYGLIESGDDPDFDVDDFEDDYDFPDEDDEPDSQTEEREPVWSLRLVLNVGGETTQVSYEDYIQDGPQDLFWSLMGWFEPDDVFDDDFEDEEP